MPDWMKNHSYYSATDGIRTYDLPHSMTASKESYALSHVAKEEAILIHDQGCFFIVKRCLMGVAVRDRDLEISTVPTLGTYCKSKHPSPVATRLIVR